MRLAAADNAVGAGAGVGAGDVDGVGSGVSFRLAGVDLEAPKVNEDREAVRECERP